LVRSEIKGSLAYHGALRTRWLAPTVWFSPKSWLAHPWGFSH